MGNNCSTKFKQLPSEGSKVLSHSDKAKIRGERKRQFIISKSFNISIEKKGEQKNCEGKQFDHSNLFESSHIDGIQHGIEINKALPFGGGSALKYNPNKYSPNTTLETEMNEDQRQVAKGPILFDQSFLNSSCQFKDEKLILKNRMEKIYQWVKDEIEQLQQYGKNSIQFYNLKQNTDQSMREEQYKWENELEEVIQKLNYSLIYKQGKQSSIESIGSIGLQLAQSFQFTASLNLNSLKNQSIKSNQSIMKKIKA